MAAAVVKEKKPYSALVGGNAVFAGVDQGIDFTGAGPVYALGPGKVTRNDPSGSGWPGEGALLVEHITGGALTGKNVYVAEDFKAAAGIAQGTVHTGQLLGYATGSGNAPGIEVGYADAAGSAVEPLLPKGSSYPTSGAGAAFNTDVQTLSAGGDLARLSNMFKVTPSSLAAPSNLQSGLTTAANTANNVATAVVPGLAAFEGATSFFGWITNPKNMIRVGEMIGGGIIIIVGIVMVGSAASKGSPARQTAQAASTVAAPVRAVSSRRRTRTATAQRAQRSAVSEQRATELHTSRVKVNQARATELRTRTKHRRRAKGEQIEAERRSYIKGATDMARSQ